MNEAARPDPAYDALLLRSQYPGYRFTAVLRPQGWSYAAQATFLGTRPWCVITSDPAEIRRELGEPTPRRP